MPIMGHGRERDGAVGRTGRAGDGDPRARGVRRGRRDRSGTRVHASTASRLLTSLAAHDLVERDGDTGRSRLGIGVLRLAAATRSGMDLTAVAGPVCDALAEEL